MEDYSKMSFCVVFVLATVFLISCEEKVELVQKKVPIEEQPYEEQVKYTKKHLKVLAETIMKQARDPEVRRLIYSEVEKRFDGEHNVLLDVLLQRNINNETLKARIVSSLDIDDEFISSLNAFKILKVKIITPKFLFHFMMN